MLYDNALTARPVRRSGDRRLEIGLMALNLVVYVGQAIVVVAGV